MMDRETLEYGILKYGTPMYVYDVDQAAATVRIYRELLGDGVGLCFAMKANPFITAQMAERLDRVEVCYMGEFCICRELNIPPEKLLISGVLKKEEDIREILGYCGGRCTYTVESPEQFRLIVGWSDANRQKVNIYLRLTSGNQFGMDADSIYRILKGAERWEFVSIKGIHYFSGTQKKNAGKIREELEFLDDFLQKTEAETGHPLSELEYGPGLAVSYFEGQEDMTVCDTKEIGDALASMRWNGSVMLEMGRAFAATCGHYLTTALDVKKSNGTNYCIVDGGSHQISYDGQIRGMYRPVFRVSPERESGEVREWAVCGSLCTVNDVLIKDAPVRGLQKGDVFIFDRAGAYSAMEGMALFLSHELPRVVIYSRESGWRPVREEQQTYRWNMERKARNNGNFTDDIK